MTAHPFDIKASALANPPDELMITWGNMPKGSIASIYLPAVASADIIALANSMYRNHRLSATDAHTVQAPSGNVTLVPVPQGSGPYAGLLSVDLPTAGHRGLLRDRRPSTDAGQRFVAATPSSDPNR